MRTLILAAAMLTCTQSFGLSLDVTANINQKVTFKYLSKKSVEKVHSLITGSTTGSVRDGGEFANINESMPTQLDENSDMALVMIDKNNVKLIDRTDGIEQVVPASISTSRGRIKKLNITNETYEAIYNKQLEAIGMNIFGSFGVSTSEIKMDISLELSDFSCRKKDDQLICEQDLSFSIKATDEFVGADGARKVIEESLRVVNSYIGGIDKNTNYGIKSYMKVLEEIEDAITTKGMKSEIYDIRDGLNKIEDYIFNDRMDSYNYDTISGKSALSILEKIKSDLESVEQLLN